MESVVNVRAEGVKRNATLTVELGTAHFGAAEATGNLNTNTLGACALRGLNALAHCTTEGNASSELFCNALCDKLSIHVGVLDLEDVELNLLAGELFEVLAEAISLCATTTNDDARASGVEVNADTITRTLNVDLRDACALEVFGQVLADCNVLCNVVRVTLSLGGRVGEPAGAVIRGDSQAEPCGVNLLAHFSGLPSSCLPWYRRRA